MPDWSKLRAEATDVQEVGAVAPKPVTGMAAWELSALSPEHLAQLLEGLSLDEHRELQRAHPQNQQVRSALVTRLRAEASLLREKAERARYISM